MKKAFCKIIGFLFISVFMMVYLSMPVLAMTSKEAEDMGASLSPFFIIGVIAVVYWLLKKNRAII